MSKKYYAIGMVEKRVLTNIGRGMALTWADGMVGAMPVFSNKKKAQKYAKERGSLVLDLDMEAQK